MLLVWLPPALVVLMSLNTVESVPTSGPEEIGMPSTSTSSNTASTTQSMGSRFLTKLGTLSATLFHPHQSKKKLENDLASIAEYRNRMIEQVTFEFILFYLAMGYAY